MSFCTLSTVYSHKTLEKAIATGHFAQNGYPEAVGTASPKICKAGTNARQQRITEAQELLC